jgi:glycosyltransferase involved in cell wall biosynthesis
LKLFGFSDHSSYTEQLKGRFSLGSSVDSSHSRKIVDFAMKQYQALFAFPDTEWPWMHSALKVANKLLSEDNYDVLLSSSPFPTVHCVSSRLKKNHKIKWIADFRDPWSQSHNYSLPRWRYFLDLWLEKKIISGADLITTVSEGVAKKLRAIHRVKVSIVRNGFQPPWSGLMPECHDQLTIAYTGTIYDGKQDPSIILITLRELIDSNMIASNGVSLNFYGRYDSKLQAAIDSLSLNKNVYQHGIISRVEVRKLQRQAQLLLVFQWEDLSEDDIVPLKFYEYLASERVILATGGSDQSELSQILRETDAGYSACSVEDCKRLIENFYIDLAKNGALRYEGKGAIIEKYSYENCSKALLQILNEQVI